MKRQQYVPLLSCFIAAGAHSYSKQSAFASSLLLNQNLLECQDRGNTLGLCILNQTPLVSDHGYHSESKIFYDFNCRGNNITTLFLKTGSGEQKSLIQGKLNESLTVSGTGSLFLFDSSPVTTKMGRFDKGCSLIIKAIDSAPSSLTKQEWDTQKGETLLNLNKSVSARDGFAELLVYKQAFSLLAQINESLLKDLNSNQILRNQLTPGSALYDNLQDMVFNTVKVTDNNGQTTELNIQDKKAIQNLINAIDSLPSTSSCSSTSSCQPIILGDYLSTNDQTLIAKAASFSSTHSKLQQDYDSFASDVLTYESKLIELCKISKPWIDWQEEEVPQACK